jgi:type III pantothenate kinase
MLLALDIGNTEITAGLFEADDLQAHWRLTTNPDRTPDEWGSALGAFIIQAGHSPNEIRAVCLASVAPSVTQSVVDGITRITGCTGVAIDSGSDLPIRLDVEEPLSVGADRIVNALAAVELFQRDTIVGEVGADRLVNALAAGRLYGTPAVVVDFGTATTFDCVTADARFIGGVIMPGLRTAADQLTRRTAKLPATELRAPPRVIGRRTEECIQSGVLYGTADAVDGIVRRIRAEWPTGRTPGVVATGGLASVIAPLTTTIEATDPQLTLQGLRIAAGHVGLRW